MKSSYDCQSGEFAISDNGIDATLENELICRAGNFTNHFKSLTFL